MLGSERVNCTQLDGATSSFGTGDNDLNRYILVQRNRVHGRFTTPKTKKSRRADMSRELRSVLLELRDKRMLEAFFKGQTSIAEDLVFPSKAGTVLDQSNLTQYHFLPCLDRAACVDSGSMIGDTPSAAYSSGTAPRRPTRRIKWATAPSR